MPAIPALEATGKCLSRRDLLRGAAAGAVACVSGGALAGSPPMVALGAAQRGDARSPALERQVRGRPRTGCDDADDSKRPHRQRRQGTARSPLTRARSISVDAPSSPASSMRTSTTRAPASTPATRRAASSERSRSRSCRKRSRERAESVPPGAVHHVHRRLEPHAVRRSATADESGAGCRRAEARRLHFRHRRWNRRDHEQPRPARSSPSKGVMVDEATRRRRCGRTRRRRTSGRADAGRQAARHRRPERAREQPRA